MRTVSVDVNIKLKLTLKCNECIGVSEMIEDLYICSETDSFDVEDMNIEDYKVTDSR